MTSEITWGDTVLVSSNAPVDFRPGAQGSVSGFRDVKQDVERQDLDSSSGQRLYLVEFQDGTAIEIPGSFLVRVQED